MRETDLFDDNDDATVFRDVIMLTLLGFVTIVVLLLPHLNPPTTADEVTHAPGNIIVEARWPKELDADVDLWVEAPGDVPVGYSNKGGRIFNLLRDDLGHSGDASGLNYEVAFTRGAPSGDYTVNLHFYRNGAGSPLPVPIAVSVSLQSAPGSPLHPIATKNVELVRMGQELTVARFSLDAEGDLISGSVHNLQRNLRAAR